MNGDLQKAALEERVLKTEHKLQMTVNQLNFLKEHMQNACGDGWDEAGSEEIRSYLRWVLDSVKQSSL